MSASTYTDFAQSQNPANAVTHQTQPIPGREGEMAKNNAGGFTFALDQWGVFDRFLLIGSETPGYYVGTKEQTAESFKSTIACVKADGLRAINRLKEISLAGRAPKNDPAVVALALAAIYGDATVKAAAYEALPQVARTGTWLFQFVSIVDSLGKWNAATKRGVANWYTSKNLDKLAIQLLKYQSRNNWSHRDVLRLAHIKPTEQNTTLFKYVVKGADGMVQGDLLPNLVIDFERLKRATTKAEVLAVVNGNKDVTWEMVPTVWHKDKDVMLALLPNMGLTAIIRKLGILTMHGVITQGDGLKHVTDVLTNPEQLTRSRIHPLSVLQAFKQYSQGRGEKGSNTWSPVNDVKNALDMAFYSAFQNVPGTGGSVFLGVDCSGSMFGAPVNGSPNLVAAEVAAVTALAIAKQQKNYFIGGFNTTMAPIGIDPDMRLDKALEVIRRFPWGGTNCALPMIYAAQKKMEVDTFVTITDNETYAGSIQPSQALRDYRKQFKKPKASNIVIGTSVSKFTIADPKDPYQLDIAGFDSAAPVLIAEFMKASAAT